MTDEAKGPPSVVAPPVATGPRGADELTLPSGRRFRMNAHQVRVPRPRELGAKPFSELEAALSAGEWKVTEGGHSLDLDSLSLTDFHALRAIAAQFGVIAETPVSFSCRNCGAPIAATPSAHLALGPFRDNELHDRELDVTRTTANAHPIPPIRLLSGAIAVAVRFSPRTLGQATPLHRALARRRLVVTKSVVLAMGVDALVAATVADATAAPEARDETDPARIARALRHASDAAWQAITQLFLDVHYPPRLFALILCPACGARNDVDAPYEREFPGPESPPASDDGSASPTDRASASRDRAFPAFDAFCQRAERLQTELFFEHEREGESAIAFVIEGGTPACDDGGEPLLGSYVPGFAGDGLAPSRAPEITLYYRTFRAMWDEEGAFDLDRELEETITHELEHHIAYLRGSDPVDDDERDEIRQELVRVVGESALVREGVRSLGSDVALFARRTWPIWLFIAVLTVLATIAERG